MYVLCCAVTISVLLNFVHVWILFQNARLVVSGSCFRMLDLCVWILFQNASTRDVTVNSVSDLKKEAQKNKTKIVIILTLIFIYIKLDVLVTTIINLKMIITMFFKILKSYE